MARTYALVFGLVYIVVALIEFLFQPQSLSFFFYTPVHATVHALAGILGLVAYWQGEALAKLYAQVFGVVFFVVFLLGVIPATRDGFLNAVLGYPINLFYNVVHLATGVFGIYAGFMGTKKG